MTAVPESSNSPQPLFSIGHSSHSIEAFLKLLDQHGIEVIADVRSSPFSKFVPQFNQNQLQPMLEQNGRRYVFLGKELGGRPPGAQYYDDAGHALYGRMAGADFFLKGLTRLEKGMRSYRVAILCSEEDPAVCHRHLLMGRVLAERGIILRHIRGDGRIEPEPEVAARSAADALNRQLSLFPEAEDHRWRSLRSVLPRDPRASSSEP